MSRIPYIAALFLLLTGCSGHGCYVGVSFFPPSPVVMCGVDVAPTPKDE